MNNFTRFCEFPQVGGFTEQSFWPQNVLLMKLRDSRPRHTMVL